MIFYLITATFILSAAIISGSIAVASHLKSTYRSELFSTLLYFLAFYFTFGFYALWGQLLATSLLQSNVDQEMLDKITDIMVLLGSPFMIFATIMFIKLTREMSGRKTRDLVVIVFIVGSTLIIIFLAYTLINYQQVSSRMIMRYYFIFLIFLFTWLGVYFLFFPERKGSKFRYKDMVWLSTALLILLAIQMFLFQLSDLHVVLYQLFILFYFLFGGFMPVYLKYKADLSSFISRKGSDISFEAFFEKHQISPREKEIIMEICKGLTNQQIADRLYISLQTVKDHTHRIYSKTNCPNRTQLIRVVNEMGQQVQNR